MMRPKEEEYITPKVIKKAPQTERNLQQLSISTVNVEKPPTKFMTREEKIKAIEEYQKVKKIEEITKEIERYKQDKEREKQMLDKQKITSPFKQRSRRYLMNVNTLSPSNGQIVYSHLHLGSPISNLKRKLSQN